MDFFIVGAPKCGTTSLFKWLATHPDIHLPHRELGFFSQDIAPTDHMDTHIASLPDYLDLCKAPLASGLLAGESTPVYLYSDRALSAISSLWPDALIVVCLRDPVELARSYHNQKLREGVEKDPDFQRAWQRSFDPATGIPVVDTHHIGGQINYLYWARLGARLERLHAFFSPDRIKTVLLRELKKAPQATYRALLDFLGLEDDGRIEFAAENQRVMLRNTALHRRALQLKTLTKPIRTALFGNRGTGVLNMLNTFNNEPGRYTSSLTAEHRHRMYQTLREDIHLAERYLDGRRLVE